MEDVIRVCVITGLKKRTDMDYLFIGFSGMRSRSNQTGSKSQVQVKERADKTPSKYLRNSLLKNCEDAEIFCGLHRRLHDSVKQKPTEDCKTQRNCIWQRKTLLSPTASEGTLLLYFCL